MRALTDSMIRNALNSVLDFLLFSNLFIACCAMAQGALTYSLLNAPVNPLVIALLGCATLFLYNFSLALSKPKDYKTSSYKRVRWFFSHYKLIISISAIALILMLPLISSLSLNSFLLLASISILAFSYNSPILKIGERRFGLRNMPGAKLFIIATVWACSCVWIPIMELRSDGLTISSGDTFLLVSKRFLFIMAITLPFDIRDIYQDRSFHLKTIPVLIGKKNSMHLCQILLITYTLFLFIFADTISSEIVALGLIALFTNFLLFNKNLKKNEYYYFLLLDGTLLLQFIASWMVNNLS